VTQNSITRPLSYRLALAAISLLLALLSGCSAARLAYRHGESVSYWWLDRYVGIEEAQRPKVRKDIADLFAWHRTTQLDSYIRNLQRAQQRIQSPVDQATLSTELDALRRHLHLLAEQALPQLAALALSLESHQIAHIEQKFASNNDDYRKEHLAGDVDDRQRRRYRRVAQRVEYWFGSLSREQEERLRRVSDDRPLPDHTNLAVRMQRQAALIALLRKIHAEKPSQAETERLLSDQLALLMTERFVDPRQQQIFEQERAGGLRLIATILDFLTPAQKQHFAAVAQQWIEEFQAMARQP
jgi:hypothetical protein